jgi:hypothetical protein
MTNMYKPENTPHFNNSDMQDLLENDIKYITRHTQRPFFQIKTNYE